MDVCQRGNRAGYKQSRRFLKCTDVNFLAKFLVVEELMRGGTLLDLRLKNKEN